MSDAHRSEGGGAPPRGWAVRLEGGPGAAAALAAAALFLASPPLVMTWRALRGEAPLDGALAWSLALSAAWLAALHLWLPAPRRLHLVLLPLWVTTVADLFLAVRFEGRLSAGYLQLAVVEAGEAAEFAGTYAWDLLAFGAGALALYAAVLRALGGARLHRPPWLSWVAAALLAVAYLGPLWRQARAFDLHLPRAAADVAAHDLSSPVGVLSQAAVAAALALEAGRIREDRRAFAFGASKAWAAPEELYVLVIGESARPDHFTMGGYARDTTPRLAALRNLVFLRDVLTTAPSTSVAVPSLLSLAPVDDWPALLRQRSVVSAFAEAGLETAWLSTQEVSPWGGVIPEVAREAGRVRYLDRAHDGALVEEVRRVLAAPAGPRRAFLVLHTRGSHFEFKNRYPPRLRRWPDQGGGRARDLVNAYDNSLLHTDEVLSDLVALLEARGGPALLVYASDHGENLLDDGRGLLGHAVGNRYDLPTAAFVWWSDALAARLPAEVARARGRAGAALSLSDLPHLLLDAAGIRARGLDPSRSIFSADFRERPRTVLVRGALRTAGPGPPPGGADEVAPPR